MRVRIKEEEKKEIINSIKEIFEERSEIKHALIFGSFLSSLPFEDIDIALILDENFLENLDFIYYLGLLEAELSQKLKRKFDIVILNLTSLPFTYSVIKEGKLIFTKNRDEFFDFVERIVYEYLDFKVFRDNLLKEL